MPEGRASSSPTPPGQHSESNVISSTHTGADAFDQPLGSWDTSAVEDMSYTFAYMKRFNQPLASWDLSALKHLDCTFYRNDAFAQDLRRWELPDTASSNFTFHKASSFDLNLAPAGVDVDYESSESDY